MRKKYIRRNAAKEKYEKYITTKRRIEYYESIGLPHLAHLDLEVLKALDAVGTISSSITRADLEPDIIFE